MFHYFKWRLFWEADWKKAGFFIVVHAIIKYVVNPL